MNRLLAFGCSLTYGTGLDDCWYKNAGDLNSSKLAWPSFLGKELSRKVCNFGICGGSNKHIWYTILNTKIKKSDLVITLWTTPDRYCFLKEDKTVQRLLPSDLNRRVGSNRRITEFYYKNLHSDYDSQIDTVCRINYINYYLKSKGIQNYNFIDTSCHSGGDEGFINETKWNEVNIIPVKFDNKLGLALDKFHPSRHAQEKLSNDMLKFIKQYEN